VTTWHCASPSSRAAALACATTCSSTTRSLDGDLTADFGGVKLTVDRMSAPYVQGATIDFVDTIEKQGFTIDNPNATGSCACGDSFN
jgi:iron-sulfur cluster assembly accessory protein